VFYWIDIDSGIQFTGSQPVLVRYTKLVLVWNHSAMLLSLYEDVVTYNTIVYSQLAFTSHTRGSEQLPSSPMVRCCNHNARGYVLRPTCGLSK